MTCFKAGVLYDKSAGTICVLSTFFNFIFFLLLRTSDRLASNEIY